MHGPTCICWADLTPFSLQFNLLADGLAGQNDDGGGFTETPAAALAWGYRKGRLLEELLRHGGPGSA